MLLTTFMLLGTALAEYTLREVGSRNTEEWRIWLENDGNPVSFWHDVPLYPNASQPNIINMVVEIPRWTDAKIETQRNEPLNPIFHDTNKRGVRHVYSVWPHKSYPFNYGSIPQTWEDSTHVNNMTGFVGDNDPVDIFDVSSLAPAHVGEIRVVKVLGGLAMIDDETTDFKVIVLDVRDPLSKLVDTVADLEKYRPGMAKSFYDWFTYYKVIKGNGLNTIIGNGYLDRDTMSKEIALSHILWRDLIRGKTTVEKINRWQTSNKRWCKTYVPSENATARFDLPAVSNVKPAAPRAPEYDQWYYLDADFKPIEL